MSCPVLGSDPEETGVGTGDLSDTGDGPSEEGSRCFLRRGNSRLSVGFVKEGEEVHLVFESRGCRK